jgi:LysM repeat protein
MQNIGQEIQVMKKMLGLLGALTLALTLSSLTTFAAANPQQGNSQSWSKQKSEKGEHTLSGELISVDTNANTFVVQNSRGKSETFRYNDETKVVGANETIAGLASQSGTRVKVTFKREMNQEAGMNRQSQKSETYRLATRIEIQSQQQHNG